MAHKKVEIELRELFPRFVRYMEFKRFLRFVDVRDINECWNWTGSLRGEYGGFEWAKAGVKLAHVAAYILFVGNIPKRSGGRKKQLCVCHSCDNPLCVNPTHLWLGTYQQNIQDCKSKGRFVGRKKLNESSVLEIKNLYASGKYTQTDLAEKFGVKPVTICAAISGRNWRGVASETTN